MSNKMSNMKLQILNFINEQKYIITNEISEKLKSDSDIVYQSLKKLKNDIIKSNSEYIF
jgi:Mn-dependent DtxR family transcriptional regulator